MPHIIEIDRSDPVSVGGLIRSKRNERGLSQSQLARELNVTISTIKNYEGGRVLPPMDRAADIGRVLGFDPRDLMAELLRDRGEDVSGAPALAPDTPVTISRSALLELLRAVNPGQMLTDQVKASIPVPEPDAPEIEPTRVEVACEALDEIGRRVDEHGFEVRGLKKRITAAKAALDDLDAEELFEVADAEGFDPAAFMMADAGEPARKIGLRGRSQDRRQAKLADDTNLDDLTCGLIFVAAHRDSAKSATWAAYSELGKRLDRTEFPTGYDWPINFLGLEVVDENAEFPKVRKAVAVAWVKAALAGQVMTFKDQGRG